MPRGVPWRSAGAALAYLHMGALGPKRVVFATDGRVLPIPASLEDNE